MINHDLKCIFVEVPKTGSTSIRSIIGHPQKPHMNIKEIQEKFFAEQIHPSNNFLKNIFYKQKAERQWNTYYKFGFVRNPWDRVVSLYLRKEGLQMADKMSFHEFVHWIENSSDTSIHPSKHKNQLDWFLDSKGNIAVDFIGKFESLNEDWKIIAKKLGTSTTLPHTNKNIAKKKHYTEYYNNELREIIAKKFQKDIDYFGYKFK